MALFGKGNAIVCYAHDDGRKGPMGLTLRDVAQEAQVSVKTVSRVLNNEPYVSKEKRDKVHQAIEKLGFRPNVQARRLKQNTDQSYLIGLLYDNPTAHYISRLLVGTLDRCDEAGYRLAVECLPSEREDKQQTRRPSFLHRDDLDGVILTPPLSDDLQLVEALERRGLAMIRITPFRERERTPYVYMDDLAAAREVTQHLLRLGHNRIAHIAGDPQHGSAKTRAQGYAAAMAAVGLSDNVVVHQGDYTFANGRVCAEALLHKRDRPTAIFAANDEMAIATIFAAQKYSLRVPEDLSVVGFDDLPFASLIEPPLTTIQQPLQAMAEAAAGLLISLQENQKRLFEELNTSTDYAVEVPFQFVLRGSTAPPPPR